MHYQNFIKTENDRLKDMSTKWCLNPPQPSPQSKALLGDLCTVPMGVVNNYGRGRRGRLKCSVMGKH